MDLLVLISWSGSGTGTGTGGRGYGGEGVGTGNGDLLLLLEVLGMNGLDGGHNYVVTERERENGEIAVYR